MALIAFLLSWPYYLVDLNRLTNSPPIRRPRPIIASQGRRQATGQLAAVGQAEDGRHHERDADGAEFHFMLVRQMVFHAARCVACHGVRSRAVPVALVGECSIPVV
jgi:hypothetical protein